MFKFYKKFEGAITQYLLAVGMVVAVVQCIELAWTLGVVIYEKVLVHGITYTSELGRNVVVLFFNVLLTLEVLETIKVFYKDPHTKIRIILIVCLIAVSRKLFTLGSTNYDPMHELALAALIVALGVAYFLVSRSKAVEDDDVEKNNT